MTRFLELPSNVLTQCNNYLLWSQHLARITVSQAVSKNNFSTQIHCRILNTFMSAQRGPPASRTTIRSAQHNISPPWWPFCKYVTAHIQQTSCATSTSVQIPVVDSQASELFLTFSSTLKTVVPWPLPSSSSNASPASFTESLAFLMVKYYYYYKHSQSCHNFEFFDHSSTLNMIVPSFSSLYSINSMYSTRSALSKYVLETCLLWLNDKNDNYYQPF